MEATLLGTLQYRYLQNKLNNKKMYNKEQLLQTIFFDIETVSGCNYYSDLYNDIECDYLLQDFHKFMGARNSKGFDEFISKRALYKQFAGLYPEFGKIVSISCGVIHGFDTIGNTLTPITIITKRHFNDRNEPEKELLKWFLDLCHKINYGSSKYQYLCGHNIKGFDVPYVIKRLHINGMHTMPAALQIYGKKPWELHHFIDTKDIWKSGGNDGGTSLDIICKCLGIPTPKGGIDGSQVCEYYWEKGEIETIAEYCNRDVEAVINVLVKLCGIK